MCIGVRGEAPFAFILNASARNNNAAMFEPFATMRLTHPMISELSLNYPVCASLKSAQTSFITSHNNSNSAHSRSEFVIVPPGFDLEIKLAVTSAGHFRRKTVGAHARFFANYDAADSIA